jgi:transcriptional regulator with XRE-family HTH domain
MRPITIYTPKAMQWRSYYCRRPCARLGNEIRRIRLASEMKVQDLSAKSGVSKLTITRMENGGNIGVELLEKILAALDCDLTITRRLP